MRKTLVHCMALLVLVTITGCDIMNIDQGDGYAYAPDNYYVWKKKTPSSGPIVLPPQDSVHDDYYVVNLYWDEAVILTVCCENRYSADSTCWRLDKKTGTVCEVTAEEFNAAHSSHKMEHDFLLNRYKNN